VPEQIIDKAGLEILPLEECLRLLASVPVGRVGLHADGELVMLPVNHAVDGQDVVFRTARGSKLSAAEKADLVAFEADDYDPRTRRGWSVVISGYAESVYEDDQIQRLSRLDLEPWAAGIDRPWWIRIRPESVSGRRIVATALPGV
jgi:uncharacterized protein